jgi:hypothetical protein
VAEKGSETEVVPEIWILSSGETSIWDARSNAQEGNNVDSRFDNNNSVILIGWRCVRLHFTHSTLLFSQICAVTSSKARKDNFDSR